MRHGALFAGVAGIVAGCSDDDPAPSPPAAVVTSGYVTLDAAKVCKIFTTDCPRKTGQTYDDCLKTYEAIRVAPSCLDLLKKLTCDTTQEDLAPCWPACKTTDAVATCDGPNILECASSGKKYAYACEGVCATQDRTWSGSCGLSYKTQKAEHDTCWCN